MFPKEPIAFWNAVGVLLFAVLSFAVDSGLVVVSPDEQGAIKAVVGAAIALIVTFIGRSKVTPV